MSFLSSIADRFGFVPKGKYEAARRLASRNYAAAAVGRLTGDWTTTNQSADQKTRQSLSILRARSQDLADDDDYASKFITMLLSNVLGENGINLRVKAKDPDKVVAGNLVPGKLDIFANKTIENAWWEWGKKENCTVTGKHTWQEVQELALSTTAVRGACLARKITPWDNKFNFALQLLEPDHLDHNYNEALSGGRYVKMGVEYNEWGKPQAYYVWKHHPYDNAFYASVSYDMKRVRVPASQMIHLYVGKRIGQTHGVPWMATSAKRLKMLDGYEEAELVASRVAAAKMGFFKRVGEVQYEGPPEGDGVSMDAEPGSFEQLPPGLELQQWDPQHPGANFPTFVKATLRGVAAGLGVSYNSLANDMESVNFASGKLGLEDERDNWRRVRKWFCEDLCEEVFKDWLMVSLVSGVIPLPVSKFDKFNAAEWRGRRWSMINPEQETNAIEKKLKLRMTSISRVLQEDGIDRDELFDEIEDDKKAMESRGITHEEVLKNSFDAYGVGVRAGVITPNVEDEGAARKAAGLPEVTSDVSKAWGKEANVRRPITLTPLPGTEPGKIGGPSGAQDSGLKEA
jgi:lambda family phage portal protein